MGDGSNLPKDSAEKFIIHLKTQENEISLSLPLSLSYLWLFYVYHFSFLMGIFWLRSHLLHFYWFCVVPYESVCKGIPQGKGLPAPLVSQKSSWNKTWRATSFFTIPRDLFRPWLTPTPKGTKQENTGINRWVRFEQTIHWSTDQFIFRSKILPSNCNSRL